MGLPTSARTEGKSAKALSKENRYQSILCKLFYGKEDNLSSRSQTIFFQLNLNCTILPDEGTWSIAVNAWNQAMGKENVSWLVYGDYDVDGKQPSHWF